MGKPRNPNRIPAIQSAGPLEAQLGALFKEQRRRAKVRLVDLADKLGCAVNTIRYHEAGQRSMRLDDVVRSADLFGCEVALLLPPAEPVPEAAPVPESAPMPEKPKRGRGRPRKGEESNLGVKGARELTRKARETVAKAEDNG